MTARIVRDSCPSGKTRYRNRRAALAGRSQVLNDCRRLEIARPPAELHVYRCPAELCSGWHLTSTPQRPPRT